MRLVVTRLRVERNCSFFLGWLDFWPFDYYLPQIFWCFGGERGIGFQRPLECGSRVIGRRG